MPITGGVGPWRTAGGFGPARGPGPAGGGRGLRSWTRCALAAPLSGATSACLGRSPPLGEAGAIRSGITAASCSSPSRLRASSGFVVPRPTPKWVADALLGWRADPHAAPLQVSRLPSPRRANGRPYVGPTGPRWPPQGVGTPSRGGYLAERASGAGGEQHDGRTWGGHDHIKDYAGPAAVRARRQHRHRCQIVETINSQLIHPLACTGRAPADPDSAWRPSSPPSIWATASTRHSLGLLRSTSSDRIAVQGGVARRAGVVSRTLTRQGERGAPAACHRL